MKLRLREINWTAGKKSDENTELMKIRYEVEQSLRILHDLFLCKDTYKCWKFD